MIPNIATLLGFAKTLEGEPLQTLRRKQTFYVAVIGHDLEFIPASSRAPRRRQYNPVKALLDQVAQRTGLLAAAPGQDVTACEFLRTYYPYQINFKLIKV